MPTDEEWFATEDDCAVCRRWPSALRKAMRTAVNVLPLRETVCEECAVTFFANLMTKGERQRPG
jgi:hypothetical protein